MFLRFLVLIFSISFSMDVFAAAKITATPEALLNGNTTISFSLDNNTATVEASGMVDEDAGAKQKEEEKKDREKTINDINTFLIESYKLKIDRILANLNISIERVTDNDPVAQAKLLEKIRGDISTKIQVINSRSISENRRKILSSVFSYIQANLDAKISRLAKQK